jgi:hypothetical protein
MIEMNIDFLNDVWYFKYFKDNKTIYRVRPDHCSPNNILVSWDGYGNASYSIMQAKDLLKDGTWLQCSANGIIFIKRKEEAKMPHFTKDMLKTGMRLVTREGEVRVFFKNMWILHQQKEDGVITNKNGQYTSISYYEDSLKHSHNDRYDIVEIYSGAESDKLELMMDFDFKGSLLWKREEKSKAEIKLEEAMAALEKAKEDVEAARAELRGETNG